MRVSVVVVNLNGEHLLPDLLDSLAAQSRPPNEVVVVDNASDDFSREVVRSRGSAVRLVERDANVGASEGRNVGTAAATGDVLVFVDNDAVAHSDWIREGLGALERHPTWGAAGSLVRFHANPDVLNGCGARLNRSLFGLDRGFGLPASSCAFVEEPCLYAMSNGLFVRRAAAEKTGPWDAEMFYYYEDADFCLRLWLEGWEVGVAPRAVLGHKLTVGPGGVSLLKAYFNERHRVRLALKHLPALEWLAWLREELTRPGGGPRLLPLRSVLRLWGFNFSRLPGVLAFRKRYRGRLARAPWRALQDPEWEPPLLPLHNFRPALDGCPPRDCIVATLNADDWRYGVHPVESVGGSPAQWIDGDAAVDVVLTDTGRRVTASLYAPAAPRSLRAHFALEDASGRVAWRAELPLAREGWTRPSWPCDLPPGRYRLRVRGEPLTVRSGGLRRRLLVAYARICFATD